jgi:hypothetical protein
MSRFCIMADWDDVPHLSDEQKAMMYDAIPEWEREARSKGIPSLGSGAVFPVRDEDIRCEDRAIPAHWPQINGLDFGWDHPFAAVNLAWDRDYDRIYVCKTYKKSRESAIIHAAAIRPWGEWIPCAWPHDGYQHDKGSGDQLKDIYRAQNLNMLPDHATHKEGGFGIEAGVMEILTRMQTDRFKVFASLNDWFAEKRKYYRDEGQIVKLDDDLMSATRIGVMMLRFAATSHSSPSRKRPNHRPLA